MENGPLRKIDFDKLTNRQLYNVFIEAVKARDSECVKECIKRDGLVIDPEGFKTVPAHFAYINDVESCGFLKGFDGVKPSSFVYGAILGDRVDLIKHYLDNYDLISDLDNFVKFAILFDKMEILEFCWFPEHLDYLLKIKKKYDSVKAVPYAAVKTNETTLSLLEKYPNFALHIMVARDEIEMLFNFLATHNTNENWHKALGEAITLQRFSLEAQILPHVEDIDCDYVIKRAIFSGDLSKVQFYFNRYKHLCSSDHIVKFASFAANNGEIVIADFLADQLPENTKMWCYTCLATEAHNKGFDYAGNCFTSRFEQMIQNVFAGSLKNSASAKMNGHVNEMQSHKHPSTPLIAQNVETPASKLSALIKVDAGSFLDIDKQTQYLGEFKEIKIGSEDLNLLLEQMLLILEQKQLVRLIRVKGQIFLSDREPAYPVLRQLTLNHSWLDRSCFLMERAKLVAVNKSTTVALGKFFEFYNAFCGELNTIKDRPTPSISSSPVLVRRVTESASVAPVIEPQSFTSVPKIKRDKSGVSSSYTPNFEAHNKKKVNKPAHKNHAASGKPHTTKLMTVQPKKKDQPHKQEPLAKPQPLPPQPAVDNLDLAKAKLLDLLALQRKNDAASNAPTRVMPNVQVSSHFDPLYDVMQHMQKTKHALERYQGLDALLIHDLALLDLLLKINRDLDDETFSTMFIHGMHHYLLLRTANFSSISSFVRECFKFGSKEVINPFQRDSHDFIRCVRNVQGNQTDPLARLKLIRELFTLQPICYDLSQSNDVNLARVGRHALSAIIIAIGEQVQQLNDTEIDKQLAALPVYKILNEYRHYRNVRHGTDYTKQVNDNTFHLVRDDWDKQLDNIISNFFEEYYNTAFVDMLNQAEAQEKIIKMWI